MIEGVFDQLKEQIEDLEDEKKYAQSMEGTILLASATQHLNIARDCLRRTIRAEAAMKERLFDQEVDISGYEQ